ncbi:hypothetical protein [Methanosarcina sp. 2.H.A.1B.4]|uniref:hypothetical protein n=1 Tax=Methanosarcina sp. 2.H.A.1B.4 TaxID=1483600 RepID=UPI000621A621|nr:hypothetical protein [Methanosarcina sp. 2.H.A.1B.4]KKG11128.1 hypothetical protein EO92_12220 [Methanosarcina sp. 2.H.A.1B.4]
MVEIKLQKCKTSRVKNTQIFQKIEKEFPVHPKPLSLPENTRIHSEIKVNGSSRILREQLVSKNVHRLLEKQSGFRH